MNSFVKGYIKETIVGQTREYEKPFRKDAGGSYKFNGKKLLSKSYKCYKLNFCKSDYDSGFCQSVYCESSN